MDELERNLTDCETLAELIPAYSIGATDAEETALVERLLQVCPEGAAELDSYLSLAQAMNYTAPRVEPPASLHDKLMAAAAGTPTQKAPPPLPPDITSVSTPSVQVLPKSTQLQPPRSRVLSFNRALAAAAGIAAALLIISNLYWVNQVGSLQQQQRDTLALMRSQQDALASLGTGSSNQVQLVSTNEGQQNNVLATVVWSPQTPTALLISENLPVLNPDRAYQLWAIQDETPVSAGVFQIDENGVGVLVFNSDQPMTDLDAVAITEEPAGGSQQPTTAPLAVAQV
jgi:anti-sigma-K factor RskA